jgi:4-amino-4-deoxy-L-arabinose transferase-like glycosyltransferase
LLAFLALCAAYGLVNPPLESPDEMYHLDYVEEILRTHRLPVAQREISEYHQPPLYYLAGAILTGWLSPDAPVAERIERNPFWAWRIGEVGVDNKPQFLHDPEDRFPGSDAWLRLYLLRLLTISSGVLAVYVTGALALRVWPRRYTLSLLSMGVIAFLPQFLALSTSINNDVPATAVSALTALALGHYLEISGTAAAGRRKAAGVAALLGLALGAGLLVKMSLLTLWPPVIGTLGIWALTAPGRERASRLRDLAIAGGVALVVAGPYLLRNWRIYGDPTALGAMDQTWGRRDPPLSLIGVLPEVHNIWSSFLARFGYGQIPVPNVFYTVSALLALLAVPSLVIVSFRRKDGLRDNPERGLMLVFLSLTVALFAAATLRYASISFTGAYGRFAFPALPAMAVLIAAGWLALADSLSMPLRPIAAFLLLMFAGFAVYALLVILRPAYTLPVQSWTAERSVTEEPGIRLGEDIATLWSVAITNPVLKPGEDAVVEVTWLPLRRTAGPLIFYVRLISPDGQLLGDRDTYPGLGRTSTHLWTSGEVFTDVIRVPMDRALAEKISPAKVGVHVGLYDPSADALLPVALWPSGAPYGEPAAVAKLPPSPSESLTGPPLFTAEDSLQLNAARLPGPVIAGAPLPVTLDWSVLRRLDGPVKLFIHLTPEESMEPLAQADQAVMVDRYPQELWAAGERFEDMHMLETPPDLPPGTYRLFAGLYREEPGLPRLPLAGPEGPIEGDSYLLGTVEITRS